MSRDPLDDFAARLFEAARNEPTPRGAVEQAVVAASRARATAEKRRATTRTWFATGVGLAVAAGVAFSLWPASPTENANITAEPAPVPPEPAKPSPAPEPTPSVSRPVSPREAPASPPSRHSASPNVAAPPSGATSLADEIDTLKRAETALGSGDAKSALEALDRYENVLHGRQMRAEAALLRMDALSRSGHADQAAALAQRFVIENPGSPLVDRARSFVAQTPPPPSPASTPKPEVP